MRKNRLSKNQAQPQQHPT